MGGREDWESAQKTAAGLTGPVVCLTGKTTLLQLTAYLSLADLVLGNDSGPVHLAAALNRPVVVPYTCTSLIRTGPYGQLENALASGVWCAGSYRKACHRMDCMKELIPDRLWPICQNLLQSWKTQSQSA
jgi:ADP-heptose:LPS heptosyltransferase